MKHITLALVAALVTLPALASADPLVGVWKTQPDRKDLVSHIEIRKCGDAYCGKVKQAFDASGAEVKTKNVGKELFWGLKQAGNGVYENGTAQIPLVGKANADIKLSGNRLTVTGCKLGVCDKQTWTRL